jgi:hypothetical protein
MRILVYNFAVSEAEVSEYQGIMRQQPANPNAVERQREIGKKAVATLAIDLANGLRDFGFTVERVVRGAPANDSDLLIDGQFLTVNEGSPLRRLVIGFGSGAAKMETRVRVYQGTQGHKLLEFDTHADSGKMPGAVATVPAGAAAPAGVGVGLAAGSAVASWLTVNPADVDEMAARSADQAVRYLSEFFARQGWLRANQVKKARLAN